MSNREENPGNFANWDKDELRDAAAKGGRASHGPNDPYASQDPKGTSNPGNFANRDKDDLREAAAKGGAASHGGTHDFDPKGSNNFADWDKDKLREAAAKGGRSS
ncbi:uncharacterized protein DNG_07014 [Cephalotrichum gorgonifer]|uniref:Uncharacterized protein n=1 Tax=Cephalotrichum gorgonifer TaxID=2041049 RepID=A0AAE8N3U7_9PEZI|nr:uncharacterized protein DNG_07014 [Cephalotrichum gorgonifer]